MSPVQAFTALACPLDGEPLHTAGGSWRCPAGHSFDVSSRGYTHLLPVQIKRSRDPGDSKEMVAARRRFLDAGGYARIAEWARDAALTGVSHDARLSVLDAGCGEGYYLREWGDGVPDAMTLELAGLDISKWAIQAAARRESRCTWIVGTNARIPVRAATLDRVLCMFGFPVYAEFARVLKPGGRLLQVDTGPMHLAELRAVVYPAVKAGKPASTTPPPGFETVARDTLSYMLQLDSPQAIDDLLAMTPHRFRATPAGRARVAALAALEVSVDVTLVQYERVRG